MPAGMERDPWLALQRRPNFTTKLPIRLASSISYRPAWTFMTMMCIQSAAPSVDSTTPAPRRIGETSSLLDDIATRTNNVGLGVNTDHHPSAGLLPAEVCCGTSSVQRRANSQARAMSAKLHSSERASQEIQASRRVYMIGQRYQQCINVNLNLNLES